MLDQLDEPAVGEAAEAYADARNVTVAEAYDVVEEALAEGVLVEDEDAGMFGTVRVAESGDSDEKREEEPDSPASNPTPESEKDGSTGPTERRVATETLADALEWFNQQLDADLPDECDHDTPRGYYEDGRGWEPDTIDEKLLGYAPANYKSELIAHLFDRGHDREAMLATGLFGERDDGNLYATWSGRYVLPYFDADGRPVFAISRATEPVHEADWKGNKYDKLPRTRDDVPVEEPIYGLDTVRDGEPVLITEGIADAITAHQAGYPCLSPVTTQFKHSDREDLRDVLDEHGADRVYLVQDAERPTSDVDDRDRLTLQQHGDGVKGAVETAAYLSDHAVDARVADLPRPGLDKVDLDDYLQRWSEDLTPLLASADPVEEHPAYDGTTAKDLALDAAKTSTSETSRTGDGSALFDLDIQGVTGLSAGYRGKNPLGHHGESENYFIILDDHGLAFDHKYKVAYTPLTYLLVDAGERRPGSPNGQLDDEEIFEAWRHAKQKRLVASDDPIPRRGLQYVARVATDWDGDFAEYETADGDTFDALPTDVYNEALEAVREDYGVEPGREQLTGSEDPTEYGTDPRNLDVVLDAHRAWDAAGRVTPDDLDEDLALDTTPDGEDWAVDGVTVDVVRAVAVAVFDHDAHDSLDADAYDRAYRHAREAYGAPLPEYVTEADAADRYDVVLGAVRALDFFDLEAEALTADVADADESGDVTHYLDPSPVDGWRDSESGESVLVFESGTVYDADTEETIDALRLVALDAGLIDSPTDDLTGGRFQRAYRLARDEYGAPLPRWAIGSPDVEPVLPPAEDLVDVVPDTDDALQDARDDVEALYRQLARAGGDVSVLRALPGLGKTTSAIKSAAEVPTSYLAPRKELQKDAAAKANDCGVSWEYLPVFGGGDICDVAVEAAVEAVREEGMGLLRNRRALLDAVDEDLYPDDDSEGADADDLDRATCSCAEGEHGDDWALAVHTARALDYRPGVIHTRAEELFGEPLPCQNEQQCEYSAGWDRIADGERPLDLVIGSYGHAHVESARTHYSLDSRGHTDRTERAVVLDEFVGDAFTEEFGDEFVDIAVWLASSLRDDVADRQDLFSADLWDDDWVRSWLRGAGAEGGQGELARDAALALADVADAVDTADDLLDAHTRFVDTHGLAEPLEDLRDSGAALDADEADRIAAALREPLGDLRDAGGGLNAMRSSADDLRHDTEDGPTGDIVTRVLDDVATPLEEYDGADLLDTLPECVGGDLRDFAEGAVQAAHRAHDAAGGVLRSVATALEGGDAGCRELAIHADDGYAHRLAHRLLYGVVAPGGGEGVADLIETDAFDYSGDGFDGTRLKHVRVDAGAGTDTILVDRDHDGATVLSPPERTAGNGEECPVVGLDATARRRLWGLMLGADVAVEDIHDSMTERARFLRDGLGLQVVRTAQKRRFYEGDPAGKDLDGDVALIEEIDDEYAGVYAGGRNEDDATVGAPAVITTKGVRRVLEDDDRLDGKVAAWDNYGNITGDNDLGEHQLAAVLGCQHYGDAPVEKVAALAGEEVTRSGHGLQLSYDSAVANTYLKHMTEDQTMQAILRFTRGDTGAVVFARTAALREDLPVVGEGQVVRSWSDTAATVAREWKAHRGERFTVGDVADSVDVSRRQVRRVLDEFASAGYLEKHHTGDGVANEFSPGENPSAGEVELPSVAMDPDTSRKGPIYTGNVRVWPLEDRDRRRSRPSRSTLPAPDTVSDGDPPGTTAE